MNDSAFEASLACLRVLCALCGEKQLPYFVPFVPLW
jgi:hypothetical protein